MTNRIIAMIFEDTEAAERAVRELHEMRVPSDCISVIQAGTDNRNMSSGPLEGHLSSGTVGHGGDTKAAGTAKGFLAGGALGAIAGLGALVIPGVGPFIAGGAIAQTLGVAGSALAVSGAVGAAAGGLAGALVDYGIERHDAEYFERRIREGDIFLAVDTKDHAALEAPIRSILRAAGGRTASEYGRERA